MMKTRIASTAALATFGLAALGAVAFASPGNAETGTTGSSDSGAGTSESTVSRPSVASPSSSSTISKENLRAAIDAQTNLVNKQLSELRSGSSESISVADAFEMQMKLNKEAQMSEMASGVVSATNSAISSIARNVK